MKRLILERVIQAIIALVALSIIVFVTSRLTGDPMALLLPLDATQADFDRMEARLGLDRPLIEQYFSFMAHLLQGDLGLSIRSREPVSQILVRRLGASFELAAVTFVFTFLVAIPLGVYSAKHRGGKGDQSIGAVALLGLAMPSFWFGILLVQVFALWLGWLPAGTRSGPLSLILPVLTMSTFGIAAILRLLRSTMINVLETDYVVLAHANGLPERTVTWQHALRNALMPVASYGGLLFVNMLSFAFVIEVVFQWPGIGSAAVSAIGQRDFPLIQAVALLGGTAAIIVNFGVDVLYTVLDPRVRDASN